MTENNTAIVLAAGQGKRMQSKIQKQFLEIQGYPVLYYSLRCFQKSPLIGNIILVTGEEMVSYCKEEIVDKYGFTKVTNVIAGGKERYDSVYAGLCACSEIPCDYVFIHDGARPFLSDEVLGRLYKDVQLYQACIAAVPAKDTIKVADESRNVIDTPDRSRLWQAQTPQVFSLPLIRQCYRCALEEDAVGLTDDASCVEYCRKGPVHLTEGSYDNLKITTPEDLLLAEILCDAYR